MIQAHFPWGWVSQLSYFSCLPQPTADHDPGSLSLGLGYPAVTFTTTTTDHDPSLLKPAVTFTTTTTDHDPSLLKPAVTFTTTTTDHDPGLAQHCEYDSYMIASDPQRHMNGHNVHKTSHSVSYTHLTLPTSVYV